MLEEASFSRKEFEIQILFSSVRLLNSGFTKINTSFVKQKRMDAFESKRGSLLVSINRFSWYWLIKIN